MKAIKQIGAALIILCLPMTTIAHDKILNIYAWSGVVPSFVIQQFEKETGIKVNLSTYENNEVMYAKLRVSKTSNYDIIIPTSNFIDRLRKQDMLEKLDKSKLPNWKHLNPSLLHLPFDPTSEYSIPYFWGTTGIFYNDEFHSSAPKKWTELWNTDYLNTLLMLDDTRDVFAISLISLGYPVNDCDPAHIKQAYEKLATLMPNVKVFSTDAIISIIIDDDATLGMVWNGDAYKASKENTHIHYIYPEEGFVIWVDNLAIPKNPPHTEAAYAFLDFMMRPDIAKETALYHGFATANSAAQKQLPDNIRNDKMIYPSKSQLKKGQYITDVGDDALRVYEKYWEALKMGG